MGGMGTPHTIPPEPFNNAFEMAVWIGENTGMKVEVVDGLTVWEAFPSIRHQRLIDRIRASIKPDLSAASSCECIHYSDIYVRFPDDSLKRPDIAIFCREPVEQTTAVTQLPEAVIEILSPNYEAKDLNVGVPFYLRMLIKDILVLDPENSVVRHFRPGQSEARYASPITMTLDCGCEVTV